MKQITLSEGEFKSLLDGVKRLLAIYANVRGAV